MAAWPSPERPKSWALEQNSSAFFLESHRNTGSNSFELMWQAELHPKPVPTARQAAGGCHIQPASLAISFKQECNRGEAILPSVKVKSRQGSNHGQLISKCFEKYA